MMGKSLFSTIACLLLSSSLMAGGFSIGEFGARSASMGNAVVAQAYDASTLFYNPAGLGFLKGTHFYGGITGIAAKSRFIGADPVFDQTIHKGKDQFFPPVGIHLTHQLTDKFAAGISLTNPFGLGVAWKDDFPGRFISKDVTLQTFYLTPVVSYRINENLSIGVGAQIIFSNVNLQRNILLFNTEGVGGTGTEVGTVELDGAATRRLVFQAV
ncbi:MAG: outer membrane protein transport protein [Calditrichae bacterium]|nr:outer membrane protein transport protein [Calditrichia bacterium]